MVRGNVGTMVNGERLSVLPREVINPTVPVLAPSGTMTSSWVPLTDRTSALPMALTNLTS
jgi:hypothetical protein